MTVASWSSFLTPLAHPVIVLLMERGGFTINEIFRVGFGMTLVMLLFGVQSHSQARCSLSFRLP